MPRVVIWKSAWLPPSETFVRNQLKALDKWTAQPLGVVKVTSILSDDQDRILFSTQLVDKVKAFVLQKTGFSRRLVHYLRDDVTLVHAHFAGSGMTIRRSAVRAHVPLLVTLHGRDITAAPRVAGVAGAYYRYRLHRLFRDAAAVIAVSAHISDLAVHFGADRSRVIVHHIGIPIEEKIPRVGVTRGILAVGRLTEKKGFEHLIRAAALLPPQLHGVPITIVGDGPLRGELETLAADLNVPVTFAGFLSGAQVRELMGERPLVCIPSVIASDGDEEGLPTVAMEAGAESCAVVGFVHSGLPDVIDSGRTGLLVTEGDAELLENAISQLLLDPERMDTMGHAARAKVSAEFDINKQSRLLEVIYDQVSGHPRP